MEKEVLNFIKHFTNFGPEVTDCFANGNCYWFAHILSQRFHGTVYYNSKMNHFACLIGENKLYDITGKCDEWKLDMEYGWYDNKDWHSWKEYHNEDVSHAIRIRRDCILLET